MIATEAESEWRQYDEGSCSGRIGLGDTLHETIP